MGAGRVSPHPKHAFTAAKVARPLLGRTVPWKGHQGLSGEGGVMEADGHIMQGGGCMLQCPIHLHRSGAIGVTTWERGIEVMDPVGSTIVERGGGVRCIVLHTYTKVEQTD